VKKALIGFGIVLASAIALRAEAFTLYTGKANNTKYAGFAFGGEIGDFLQLQIDVMKYLKDDPSLHSDLPELSRGDFLGVSGNFVLQIPLQLIPHLNRFDYIRPYILVGRGIASENIGGNYNDAPNPVDGKTGIFNKLRSFSSFGYGLVVMISPAFGLKVDYRSLNLSAHTGLGLPGRKFNRLSIGICFGPYKKEIKRIKK